MKNEDRSDNVKYIIVYKQLRREKKYIELCPRGQGIVDP